MGGLSALAGLLATESFNRKPKACAFLPDVSLFGNACAFGFGLNDCAQDTRTLIVCSMMRGM